MALIIPLLLFLLFDYFLFTILQLALVDYPETVQYIGYFIHWAMVALALVLFWGRLTGNVEKWNKSFYSFVRSTIFIVYFGKFIAISTMVLIWFGKGLIYLFDQLVRDGNYEVIFNSQDAGLSILAGAIPTSMMIYGMIRNPYRYKIYKSSVPIENLPKGLEGLKIVQISDVHSGSFTKPEEVAKGIELINQQNADLVFFTGDLVNNLAREMIPYLPVFQRIKSKYGIYSVLGNHDYGDYVRWETIDQKKENLLELFRIHKALGWDLMRNEHRMVTINNEKIAILGVENFSAHPRFPKYGFLNKAWEGTQEAVVKILLSHDPSHWKYEVVTGRYQDIDLTLSGHTHGMQFGLEIGDWFKWSPIKYAYKEWAGLYHENKQYLYVNRGFGFLGYPGRVGILPEITLLELISK